MTVAVFTHLDLTSLATSTYGIYQRLRVLLEGSQRLGDDLTVICGLRLAEGRTGAEVETQSRENLQTHWGIDARVVCVPFGPPLDGPWILQQFRAALLYRWSPILRGLSSPDARAALRRAADEATIIVAHRLPLMTSLLNAGPIRAPVFFDLDDIEPIALWRHARTNPSARARFFIRLSCAGITLAMWRAIRHARLTFVCSELDRARLAQRAAGRAVRVVPNSTSVNPQAGPVADAPVLLMVGVYSFRPNADGADYFIDEVWPRVKAAVPDAELWLAGAGVEHLRSYARRPEGVSFLGFVDDLNGVYARSRAVICPLRSGGGTRIKLLEAAGQRRPVVSTRVGAEGIGFQDGEDAFIVDDAASFAARCIQVLEDKPLAERLALNAYRRIERDYARGAVVDLLRALIQSEAPTPGARGSTAIVPGR